MTPIQQLQFCASIQIGTEIISNGNNILVVTKVTSMGFKGYSKYAFEKYGKKTDSYLTFETIQNPHYNKDLKINTAAQ